MTPAQEKRIGAQIRKLRESHDLSQDFVAQRGGLARESLNRAETGKIRLTDHILAAIYKGLEACGVRVGFAKKPCDHCDGTGEVFDFTKPLKAKANGRKK